LKYNRPRALFSQGPPLLTSYSDYPNPGHFPDKIFRLLVRILAFWRQSEVKRVVKHMNDFNVCVTPVFY
jgi:hypothetical protein